MSMEVGLTWTSVVLVAFVVMVTEGGYSAAAAAAGDIARDDALERCLRDPLPLYEIEWSFKPVFSPFLVVTWNVSTDGQLSDGSTCNSSLSCFPSESLLSNGSGDYSAMPTQLRPIQIQRGKEIRFPSLLSSGNGTVRFLLVDEIGFLECDETRGRLLPLSSDGSSSSRRLKTVDAAAVSSSYLKTGVNYLIAVDVVKSRSASFYCQSGLRLNITIKDNSDCNRLSNQTCFNRGRCVANFTSSSFYCRCCPGFDCLRGNMDDITTSNKMTTTMINMRNNNNNNNNNNRMMIQSNANHAMTRSDGYKTKPKLDQILHQQSRCNTTTTTITCRTPNNTTCVIRDKDFTDPHCSCTNSKSDDADCATDDAETETRDGETEDAVDDDDDEEEDEEEERMDICDPNPCLNGICIVDGKLKDSFRCYCVPGFGGRLCDMTYTSPCSPNPCKNEGVCRPTNQDLERGVGEDVNGKGGGGNGEGGDKLRSFECLCRSGYVRDDCSFKVSLCQSNPCLHVCFDHGDYYVCECNPGFTGENCDVLINTCESNPCQNGGTCDSTPYGYSCQCTFGYHGNHCAQHAFPDFLVPAHHPPQLHSLQMVGFTLTGAVAIATLVIVCCYCNVGHVCDHRRLIFCPSKKKMTTTTTTRLSKYEKHLDHYKRRASIANLERKRRRNQSLDGHCAKTTMTTNAFMDDDVETTSLQDRLYVEDDDYDEDPTSGDVRDDGRGSAFRNGSGPFRAGRSLSRLNLLDV